MWWEHITSGTPGIGPDRPTLGRTGSVLTTMVSAFLPDTGMARTVVLSTTTVGTMTVTGTIEITTNENHRDQAKPPRESRLWK